MNGYELLRRARDAGMTVTRDGEHIRVRRRVRNERTDRLLDLLRENKAELLAVLRRPKARPCEAGVTACGAPARLYPCGWRCETHRPGAPIP